MIEFDYFTSAFGKLKIATYEEQIVMLDFEHRKNKERIEKRLEKGLNTTFVQQENSVIQQCKQELEEYFKGTRTHFTLPLLMVGTSFQKKVWQALQTIAYGKTTSYLNIAKIIEMPSSVRAVANANGANAIGIIIPCHRIIGSNNTLTGYAGGLELKQKLLELENAL